jgi:hypothetical protein
MEPPRTALVLLLAALGCTPTYHKVERIRFDRPSAAALEEEALEICEDPNGPNRTPSEVFVTDGCTLWPDAWFTGTSWQTCCIKHDVAYWCGGPGRRAAADHALRSCVEKEFAGWMGWVMWLGSRVMAGPGVPAHWRWGYGNDYPSD